MLRVSELDEDGAKHLLELEGRPHERIDAVKQEEVLLKEVHAWREKRLSKRKRHLDPSEQKDTWTVVEVTADNHISIGRLGEDHLVDTAASALPNRKKGKKGRKSKRDRSLSTTRRGCDGGYRLTSSRTPFVSTVT